LTIAFLRHAAMRFRLRIIAGSRRRGGKRNGITHTPSLDARQRNAVLDQTPKERRGDTFRACELDTTYRFENDLGRKQQGDNGTVESSQHTEKR